MAFRSVKLFFLFIFIFSVSGLSVLFLSGRVFHSFEIPAFFPSFSPLLKLAVLAVAVSLFLIFLQTLYCALTNRLISLFFHASLAVSIFLILLFPLTSKTSSFYLYPGSFVEVNGKRVALADVVPAENAFSLKVFIEEDGRRVTGEVSFNSPFFSDFGTLWFSGVRRSMGMPLFEFRFLEPSPLPILLLLSGVLTVLFGLFYTISSLNREGKDVR